MRSGRACGPALSGSTKSRVEGDSEEQRPQGVPLLDPCLRRRHMPLAEQPRRLAVAPLSKSCQAREVRPHQLSGTSIPLEPLAGGVDGRLRTKGRGHANLERAEVGTASQRHLPTSRRSVSPTAARARRRLPGAQPPPAGHRRSRASAQPRQGGQPPRRCGRSPMPRGDGRHRGRWARARFLSGPVPPQCRGPSAAAEAPARPGQVRPVERWGAWSGVWPQQLCQHEGVGGPPKPHTLGKAPPQLPRTSAGPVAKRTGPLHPRQQHAGAAGPPTAQSTPPQPSAGIAARLRGQLVPAEKPLHTGLVGGREASGAGPRLRRSSLRPGAAGHLRDMPLRGRVGLEHLIKGGEGVWGGTLAVPAHWAFSSVRGAAPGVDSVVALGHQEPAHQALLQGVAVPKL